MRIGFSPRRSLRLSRWTAVLSARCLLCVLSARCLLCVLSARCLLCVLSARCVLCVLSLLLMAIAPAVAVAEATPSRADIPANTRADARHATADPGLAFAVLTDLPATQDDVPRAQALLQWIGTAGKVRFIVHLGNIKGVTERCSDALFSARRTVLDSTPGALIYVPGQNDWAGCSARQAGNADPLARLDALRDGFFGSAMSLGLRPLRLIRQSELPAFRPYRENTRWIDDDVVFVTLNVPDDNNHFVDGGGRNGEYEDREIANRYWIARATIDARRRRARALVFFFNGDPHFEREAHGGFRWWFRARRERDGFAPLRRDLINSAHGFPGPVLVIHAGRATGTQGPVLTPVIREIGNARGSNGAPDIRQITVGTSVQDRVWLRVVLRGNDRAGANGTNSRQPIESVHAELERAPRLSPTADAPAATASAVSGVNVGVPGTGAGAYDGMGAPPEGLAPPADSSSAIGDITTPTLLPLPPPTTSELHAPATP